MKTLRTLLPRIVTVVLVALLLLQIGAAVRARMLPASPPAPQMSWAYHPENLKQAYDLSDIVVVAKVTSVTAGPELVAETTSPDHPTMTLDSTLVNVSVITPLKGKVVSGDEVTVYRQINIGQNTGPTQHAVADVFLLFLRASSDASDGSYYILSPEGNYRIVNGRLNWSWSVLADRSDSFASKLDGAQLDTVLQQIDSLQK